MKKDTKLTFKTPDGFDTEGKEEGDTIEAVAELEIEKDGKLCLKKLNGIALYPDKKEPEVEPSMGDRVMSKMI